MIMVITAQTPKLFSSCLNVIFHNFFIDNGNCHQVFFSKKKWSNTLHFRFHLLILEKLSKLFSSFLDVIFLNFFMFNFIQLSLGFFRNVFQYVPGLWA